MSQEHEPHPETYSDSPQYPEVRDGTGGAVLVLALFIVLGAFFGAIIMALVLTLFRC